jgi:hypothetical protein
MRNLLSLDPGVTTGYCLARMVDTNGSPTCELAYNEATLQPADLLLMLQDLDPSVVVYEGFKYRNRSRSGLELFSVQLIGIINAYGTLAPDCFIKEQQPAQAMGHFTDSKLRQLGLYQKGTVHGRDAARHMLHFMEFGAGYQYWGKHHSSYKMVSYSTFGA